MWQGNMALAKDVVVQALLIAPSLSAAVPLPPPAQLLSHYPPPLLITALLCCSDSEPTLVGAPLSQSYKCVCSWQTLALPYLSSDCTAPVAE